MSASQDSPSFLAPDTLVVGLGRPDWDQGSPVNPPVVLSSTYVSRGMPEPGELFYTRADTESWHGAEDLIGELEGAGRPAVLFGSGMAAIAAAFSLIPLGGRLILPRHAYQVALAYADDLAARGYITVDRVDIAQTDDVVAALRSAPTAMLWIESPTNPMLEIADIPALAAAAHDVDAIVAVDNTFSTPLGQRPLSWGVDLVVHSVTKYLAGHSDVVLGAVVAASADLDAAIRRHRVGAGAIAGPWEAWLALRGMRTLALRVERSGANATELARRLAQHPRVVEVRHPSLPSDPGHERAKALMSGFGSIIAIRVAGGAAAADAVTYATRLWRPATSLGGVESSLERRRRWSTETVTVPEDLLRLSVGIENVEDLWHDLDRALDESAELGA